MQCCPLEQVSDPDIQEAAHYSKYAFAAYGYMLFIWSKPQYKCVPHLQNAVWPRMHLLMVTLKTRACSFAQAPRHSNTRVVIRAIC